MNGDAQQPGEPGSPEGRAPSRRRRYVLLSGVVALLAVGALLLTLGLRDQQPAPPGIPRTEAKASQPARVPKADKADPGESASPAESGADAPSGAADPLPASAPVRVQIPTLKVDSTLESLKLDKNRVMTTPVDPAKAGWFTPGPKPGSEGPAVIAGHVTWNGARSVFFSLASLKEGARVNVKRADGKTAEFTVDKVARYPKDKFPTIEVYRNLDYAGLRLITCGGDYSDSAHHYADNIVVYAHLTGTSGA